MMNKKEKKDIQDRMTEAHFDFAKGLNARAFFKTQNHSTGEDLVQDTFMKTWKYLVKGGKIDIMKAFLYHILNHLIIDEYRKRKTTSLEVLIEKGFEPRTQEHESLTDILDGKMAIILIKLLPVEYQKVMHMKYVQDLSLKDIALLTGSTKNAVAVKTHRGLEKLKILYQPK